MSTRLKRHKSGAQLTLRGDDLVHALIMPPSINVHIVRIIVSQDGNLEFGEWITGGGSSFQHKEEQLAPGRTAELANNLKILDVVERRIDFGHIECDYGEYEGKERVLLWFWSNQQERGVFLPSSQFYLDYDLSNALRDDYESAFKAVMNMLPLHWITSTG